MSRFSTLSDRRICVLDQHVDAFPTTSDLVLIRAWTHNRPANTAAAYRQDATKFLAFAAKPIAQLDLADLQAWDQAMAGNSPASRARRLNAVRSLLRFAIEMGAVAGEPAKGLRVPRAAPQTDRIVTEPDVSRMIDGERDARRRALLRLLYLCGLRASEAAAACWRDVTRTRAAADLRVLGKGGRTRVIPMPAALWRQLTDLAPASRPEHPLVPGRDGAPLTRQAVHRIVKRAARRAGLPDVSAHWLRHSHASHALDRGAPVHTVQQTLGHASLATTTRYAHARDGDSSTSYLGDV